MPWFIPGGVSLIRGEQYKNLKLHGGLKKPNIEIDQVDRKPVKITGMVRLWMRVEGTTKFYVASDFFGGGCTWRKIGYTNRVRN